MLTLAGLADTDLTPHSMRHSFATWHIMRGRNAKWIQQQLGHAKHRVHVRRVRRLVQDRGCAGGRLARTRPRPVPSWYQTRDLRAGAALSSPLHGERPKSGFYVPDRRVEDRGRISHEHTAAARAHVHGAPMSPLRSTKRPAIGNSIRSWGRSTRNDSRSRSRSDDTMAVVSLDEARAALDGAVLGPAEITAAVGFDPLAVLGAAERQAVTQIPFSAADLASARANGEFLVLRVPRDPKGPLTMLRLAEHLAGGLDAKVHRGVGYLLRDEWTVDAQPFATSETCSPGWRLVRREPLPATFNSDTVPRRTFSPVSAPTRPGSRAGGARSRSPGTRCSGIARTTSGCWRPAGTGRAARATTRASPRSGSSDPGPRRGRLLAARCASAPWASAPSADAGLPPRRDALLGAPPRVLRHHEAARLRPVLHHPQRACGDRSHRGPAPRARVERTGAGWRVARELPSWSTRTPS